MAGPYVPKWTTIHDSEREAGMVQARREDDDYIIRFVHSAEWVTLTLHSEQEAADFAMTLAIAWGFALLCQTKSRTVSTGP